VSETADGDAPHAATGCPFRAWSVAELLRAREMSILGDEERP
jgi:glycogen debranching enzyme